MRKTNHAKSTQRLPARFRKGDQQYHLLFELNPCPMYVFDENSLRILDVNRAMVKLYGWSRAELLRMSAKDIRPSNEIRQFRMAVKQQVGIRAAHLGEWRHQRKDGSLIVVEITASSVQFRDHDARLVMVNDVTARKRTEQQLLETEEFYRTVADFTRDCEFWEDPQGRFTYVSPSCKRITGYTPAEIATTPNLRRRMIHPDDRDRFDKHIRSCEKKHQPGEGEWRIRRADGVYRWIAHVCQPVFDKRGQYRGVRSSNRDITQQKQAAEILKRSEARFRSYFESSTCGIAITSASAKWIEVNDCLCEMLGYSKKELAQRTWTELTHPEDLKLDLQQFQRVLAGEIESYAIDKRFLCKNGKVIWTSLFVRCVRHEDRSVDYCLALLFDITERKQADEQLRKLTSELEQRIQERTAELQQTNSSLIRALGQRHTLEQQILEISEREQRRIGHDLHDSLGQRLAALKFMSGRLARRLTKNKLPCMRIATQIERELQHALEETREIARGLHPVRPEGEGLKSALYEMTGSVTRLFKVRCGFSCSHDMMIHDHNVATNLYRIAQEAISNAIRHARARHVWVRLRRIDGLVRLSIEDNGRGLQAHSKEGTGLGLEIMRYRASVIGAGLNITKRRGGGTRVVCSWIPPKLNKGH